MVYLSLLGQLLLGTFCFRVTPQLMQMAIRFCGVQSNCWKTPISRRKDLVSVSGADSQDGAALISLPNLGDEAGKPPGGHAKRQPFELYPLSTCFSWWHC